jgi:hypothetical protein
MEGERFPSWTIPIVILDDSEGRVECFAHALGETQPVPVLRRGAEHGSAFRDSVDWVLCLALTGTTARLHLYYGQVDRILDRAVGDGNDLNTRAASARGLEPSSQAHRRIA